MTIVLTLVRKAIDRVRSVAILRKIGNNLRFNPEFLFFQIIQILNYSLDFELITDSTSHF